MTPPSPPVDPMEDVLRWVLAALIVDVFVRLAEDYNPRVAWYLVIAVLLSVWLADSRARERLIGTVSGWLGGGQ